MKFVVGTYFTKSYTYSIDSWLEHTHSALLDFEGDLILSTDHSPEALAKVESIQSKMKRWRIHHIVSEIPNDDEVAYKEQAQWIIVKLQNAAFSRAREINPDYFWSIESDILVPPNSLKVLVQSLEFDDGFYGVGMVTYPNGQFLGGRGSPTRPIEEDIREDERVVPAELRKKISKAKADFESNPSTLKSKTLESLMDEVKKCPARGNIFELQAKKWRKRGWLDSAYPGIGRGAILPTDWVGLGCTLMNKKALRLATFDGYELQGTQDLFLCWHRWHPNDVRMCVIPHILCSHIKREQGPDGRRTDTIKVHHAYHETQGECVGHLRWMPKLFIGDKPASRS